MGSWGTWTGSLGAPRSVQGTGPAGGMDGRALSSEVELLGVKGGEAPGQRRSSHRDQGLLATSLCPVTASDRCNPYQCLGHHRVAQSRNRASRSLSKLGQGWGDIKRAFVEPQGSRYLEYLECICLSYTQNTDFLCSGLPSRGERLLLDPFVFLQPHWGAAQGGARGRSRGPRGSHGQAAA